MSRILLRKSFKLSASQIRAQSSSTIFGRVDEFGRQNENVAAIFDEFGRHTYGDIVKKSNSVARALTDEKVLDENVSFLTPNNASYAFAQFGIWKSGNSGVPLCKSHPAKTLDYYIGDSKSKVLIATRNYVDKVFPLVQGNDNRKLLVLEDIIQNSTSGNIDNVENVVDKNAVLIYTSGTTGSPKGVVLTHRILSAQIENLLEAWSYSKEDCLLHVLPLHHTHGIVNCLLGPLAVGGRVQMLESFDAGKVWRSLLSDEKSESRVNLFMAVPTIYAKLIEFFHKNVDEKAGMFLEKSFEEIRNICNNEIRLMVSGSAALPQPILEEWEKISGHVLLERYGMTELGMALTNPMNVKDRKPGFVGIPFPSVRARIVKEGTETVLVEGSSKEVTIFDKSGAKEFSGDLQIQGPNVFKGYFGRPEATLKEFTSDSWFKTGDTALVKDGAFKILGRSSVDIIKSGGYKISALDIERILLSHPAIVDVEVLGVEDITWGQKVAAVIVLNAEVKQMDLDELRNWAKDLMPAYSLPSLMKIVREIPKNAMGKVNKKELVKIAFPS